MSGVVTLFAIFIGIFLSLFFPNMPYASNVLPNLLDFLQTLGDNGLVGLIVLVFVVCQYFLAYYLYDFLKKLREDIKSSYIHYIFISEIFPHLRRFRMKKENMFGACAFVIVSSMFYVVGLIL